MRKKVLFLCTHNSARSQIAEALVNHFWKDRYQACSAGTEPGIVNPYAVKVMNEIGIDISAVRSKNTSDFIGEPFDLVITVCDNAKQNCPFFPGAKEYIHKSFKDPSEASGSKSEAHAIFREIRDEIHTWLKEILK
jgi:arsenate reductase